MRLRALYEAGALDALDLRFAEMLGRVADVDDERVLLGAAFANRAPTKGHVCAHLAELADTLPREVAAGRALAAGEEVVEALELPLPEPGPWIEALEASPLTRGPHDLRPSPLVLDGSAVYLDRLWRHQQRLVDAIRMRMAALHTEVDAEQLRAGLERVFPRERSHVHQRVAAQLAVLRNFTVIVGGPGTGKTATVVRVLALLQAQARARGRRALRVALAAPTGKAAARMTESIRKHRATLDVDEDVRAAIPEQASTIHRLLGWKARSTGFKHHADNPLAVDVVVVDEASMVALNMMARLVDAVPLTARLVLLGDRDQLASVEAGAVLGDLWSAGGPRFSVAAAAEIARLGEPLPETMVDPEQPPGVADNTVELTHTWRFSPESGIHALAQAINRGDADATLSLLADPRFPDVERVEVPEGDDAAFAAALRERAVAGFAGAVAAQTPTEAFEALAQFRVLCAHRRGRRGVGWLNHTIERWLAEADLIEPGRGGLYRGRPIMVTRNDRALGLNNGDVGITLPDDGALRVWFPHAEGPRALSLARLPAHDTVYATTVHKSQGSEFDQVLVLLPDRPSPIITRELLYTAVTRASGSVLLVGRADTIRAGVEARVARTSGLAKRLR